ncbi:chromosomal replication initiator protein DnaA [bacterium]|nr:chromosomal replication initiator protein DnaA [bacterium]
MNVATENSAASAWSACLEFIKPQIKSLTFKTWFEPILPTSLQSGLLTVEVPSTYFYEWLEEHFFDLIQAALHEVLGDEARLQYAVKIPKDEKLSPAVQHNPYPTGATGGAATMGAQNGEMRHMRSDSAPRRDPFVTNLNPKFTFDSFIRGDGNQFARAAALNVANNPGETAFNPLVLYGGVGLGKTHLIQAIGNYVSMNNPQKRVYYVSSEKFTIDFVEAIEKNNTIEFSNFYRSMDVLILDDIQFFSGKERTQDTFFHTFNTLHQLKKQIILSSDRPPKDLVGLDERLISRFQCGLTVDVQPPDLETRIAILRKKADGDHIDIPQEVIEFIASNVKSNIRELEGCYIGLIARHTLEQCPLDVNLAEKVLRNVIDSEKKDITVEQIQKMVADHFKIPENSLRAKTRKQEIVLPRQVAMYLSKNLTRASLKTIGLHFGGRDHSTIIHACKTIERSIASDDSLRMHVEKLEKQISYISR